MARAVAVVTSTTPLYRTSASVALASVRWVSAHGMSTVWLWGVGGYYVVGGTHMVSQSTLVWAHGLKGWSYAVLLARETAETVRACTGGTGWLQGTCLP